MNVTKSLPLIFFTLATALMTAYAKDNHNYGRLIFEDHFERNELQETKEEPGNGWTTSRDKNKTAKGNKQEDLRDGKMYISTL